MIGFSWAKCWLTGGFAHGLRGFSLQSHWVFSFFSWGGAVGFGNVHHSYQIIVPTSLGWVMSPLQLWWHNPHQSNETALPTLARRVSVPNFFSRRPRQKPPKRFLAMGEVGPRSGHEIAVDAPFTWAVSDLNPYWLVIIGGLYYVILPFIYWGLEESNRGNQQ